MKSNKEAGLQMFYRLLKLRYGSNMIVNYLAICGPDCKIIYFHCSKYPCTIRCISHTASTSLPFLLVGFYFVMHNPEMLLK